MPFLGELPLHLAIRVGADEGNPVVAVAPDSAQARPFFEIAAGVLGRLDQGAAKPPPRIVFV